MSTSDTAPMQTEKSHEVDVVVEKIETPSLPLHTLLASEPISDNPAKIHSHFCRVSEANRKGQARFQCVKCGHEFECSGRKRLIQHIIGYSHQANRYKNVRACSNPHIPLKEALMTLYPKHVVPDGEKKRRRRRKKEELFTAKMVAEMRAKGVFGDSVLFDDFYPDSKRRAGVETNSPMSLALPSFLLPPTDNSPPNAKHYFANQTLYQLLASHGLSVSLVDDPLFVEFLNAVRLAGDDYCPTMQSVVQDNLLSLLLTNSSQSSTNTFTGDVASKLSPSLESATSPTLTSFSLPRNNNNDNNNDNNNLSNGISNNNHLHINPFSPNHLFLSESQR